MELRGGRAPLDVAVDVVAGVYVECVRLGLAGQPCVPCVCVSVCVLAGDVSFLGLITTLIPDPCFCPFLRLCGSCVGTLWIASPPKHAGPCYPAIHLCY